MTDSTNTDDLIDSRDVIARIEELEADMEDMPPHSAPVWDNPDYEGWEEREELSILRALAIEGEGSPDWEHGETLIHHRYFAEYAQELAEDIGAIAHDAQWPLGYIDWTAASDALKIDYLSVDFDGQEYWIRA